MSRVEGDRADADEEEVEEVRGRCAVKEEDERSRVAQSSNKI
jgi:hypothetical protein